MRFGSRLLVIWAAIILTRAAWAQVPAGPVLQVNSYTTGRQYSAHVAMEVDGDFVVVWDHRDHYLLQSDIFARRFTAGGAAVGLEFRVNAYTTAGQTMQGAGVSQDARGNTVVVWTDGRNDFDAFGRRVTAAGVPLGTDFKVNSSTTGLEGPTGVAVAPDGRFVVAWYGLPSYDVFARRFDTAGNALGDEFRVNTYTTGGQRIAEVGIDAAANFTVVWESFGQAGIFGQRFDAAGQRLGGEFQVNAFVTGSQLAPAIAMRRDGAAVVAWEGRAPGASQVDIWARRISSTGAPQGVEFRVSSVPLYHEARNAGVAIDEPGNFVVTWSHYDGLELLVKGRRFAADGAPRGGEFQVAMPTTFALAIPKVASDGVGNFVVSWADEGPDDRDVFAQRFGGLFPAGLTLSDGGNGVLEVPDDFGLVTSWRNLSGAAQTFEGRSSNVVVPSGLVLTLSPSAGYGTVADGTVGSCTGACFAGGLAGTRPAGHVDVTFVETIVPDVQGQAKRWVLHVGESFADVPRTSGFYRFVETLLHRGITGGCTATAYCPLDPVTREQMAVFLLLAKEGAGYAPPACVTPPFNDVPPGSPFCRWIEELARRSITGGCGGGNYCPTQPVTREQMAVFLLRTLDPALDPPACSPPNLFDDVPETSAFCRWIEELARRGITGGCGGGNFCPTAAVTREQMAAFLTVTFGLTLYRP